MKERPKPKKVNVRINPRAEVVASTNLPGGGASISKSLSSKGAIANIDLEKKGISVGGTYETEGKRIGFRGSYRTPKGGTFSATKDGKFYSASYTSPKGVTISADTEKNIDIDIPRKKGGSVGASISPSILSARYITKKGVPIEASYGKENKMFNIGTRIRLNKKK